MDTEIGPNDVDGPPSQNGSDSMQPSKTLASLDSTVGGHVARRLVEIGVTDVFTVPGDFNLTLLDHLIAEKGLTNVGCCNKLSAGYAANGYARSRGVGACVVTFTIGGLSVLNAIARAHSENLPVICIVGGPNSNDYGTYPSFLKFLNYMSCTTWYCSSPPPCDPAARTIEFLTSGIVLEFLFRPLSTTGGRPSAGCSETQLAVPASLRLLPPRPEASTCCICCCLDATALCCPRDVLLSLGDPQDQAPCCLVA